MTEGVLVFDRAVVFHAEIDRGAPSGSRLLGAVQHRDNMRAGEAPIGQKTAVHDAAHDAPFICPAHRRSEPRVRGHILKRQPAGRVGRAVKLIQKRRALRAGADALGLKRRRRDAACGAGLNSPADGGIKPVGRSDVFKRLRLIGIRAAGEFPEEGGNLRAGAGRVRAEGLRRHAVRDAVFDRPVDRIGKVGVLRHIDKRRRARQRQQNRHQKQQQTGSPHSGTSFPLGCIHYNGRIRKSTP